MIQSSFPTVADQIISANKNVIEILGQINTLATTQEKSINFRIYDENGILKTFAIPSFNSLKGDIDRLNNNINSLYNIDATGAIIATSNQNKYKKIIMFTSYFSVLLIVLVLLIYTFLRQQIEFWSRHWPLF